MGIELFDKLEEECNSLKSTISTTKHSTIGIIEELKQYELFLSTSKKMVSAYNRKWQELQIEMEERQKEIQNELTYWKKSVKEQSEHLNSLKAKINDAAHKMTSLKYQLIQKQEEKDTWWENEFENYVKSVRYSNSLVDELEKGYSTIELLDDFSYYKKEFLVLEDMFYLLNNFMPVSLIVVRKRWECETEETQPTFTELKQSKGKSISRITKNRMMPLINKLKEIDEFNDNILPGTIFTFKPPFMLGGQTSSNRTDYGCEWIGGGDYITNTLYGDVTDYMIVGAIVGKLEQSTFYEGYVLR